MSTESNVTFVGNLTGDGELRFTAGGKGVYSNSLAVEKRRKNATTGEWESTTSFVRISVWDSLGENFTSLAKGTRVIVSGTLEVREYEKDGEKRQSIDVTVEAGGPELRWSTAEVTKVKSTSTALQASGAKPRQPAMTEEEPF